MFAEFFLGFVRDPVLTPATDDGRGSIYSLEYGVEDRACSGAAITRGVWVARRCAYGKHVGSPIGRGHRSGGGQVASETRGQCAFPFIFVLRDFVWSG